MSGGDDKEKTMSCIAVGAGICGEATGAAGGGLIGYHCTQSSTSALVYIGAPMAGIAAGAILGCLGLYGLFSVVRNTCVDKNERKIKRSLQNLEAKAYEEINNSDVNSATPLRESADMIYPQPQLQSSPRRELK